MKDICSIVKFIILAFIIFQKGKSIYIQYQIVNNDERLLHDVIFLSILIFLIVGVFHVIYNFIERYYKGSLRKLKIKKLVIENMVKEFEHSELNGDKSDEIVLAKSNLKKQGNKTVK